MIGAILKFTGLSKLGGLLVAAGAFLALILGALFKARRSGAQAERAKQTEIVNEKVEAAREAVQRLDADPSERKRLRKRRSRD